MSNFVQSHDATDCPWENQFIRICMSCRNKFTPHQTHEGHAEVVKVKNVSFHEMVNGKWLPDFIERLKASAWHQLYLPLLPFTHARSESINADSLKLQLLTARKKEWWPATADSLPLAVTCTVLLH